MVKHQHASGEYNQRRRECEKAARLLAKWYPGIRALRDVSVDQLLQHSKDIPDKIYRRCRQVLEENERVRDGAQWLRVGNLNGFGELMRESHHSLRDLYEVSCREVDIMVEAAEGLLGYYGGRMTGGGFGGSTINLVDTANAQPLPSKSPTATGRRREFNPRYTFVRQPMAQELSSLGRGRGGHNPRKCKPRLQTLALACRCLHWQC
jgi:galactokinase